MFKNWHLKKLKAGSGWHVLVPEFETSTESFYDQIRQSVESRRIPDIEIAEIEFREGGALSARRRYLRLRRERLVFDVCSAPFGTSWFFSCRFGEIPLTLKSWEVVLILAAMTGLLAVHGTVFGWAWGSLLFVLNIGAFLFLLNNLVATGQYGLDAALLKVPVIGAFYECFLRGGTYHREDSRSMFCSTVDRLVRDAVELTTDMRSERDFEFEDYEEPGGLASKLRAALRKVG